MSNTVPRRKKRVNKTIKTPIEDVKNIESAIEELDFTKINLEEYLEKYNLYEKVIKDKETEIEDYRNSFKKISKSDSDNNNLSVVNTEDTTFQEGIDKMTSVLDFLEIQDSKNPDLNQILKKYAEVKEIMLQLENKISSAELKLVQVN